MSREVILEMEDDKFGNGETQREVELVESDTLNKSNVDEANSSVKEDFQPPKSKSEMAYADDEEDVPSDFFDDFSNQDFMAGLDIVDAWDDEEEEDGDATESGNRKSNQDKPNSQEHKQNKSKGRIAEQRPSSRSLHRNADKRRHSREQSRDGKRRQRLSKDKVEVTGTQKKDIEKPKKNILQTEIDKRRDPEKTKRDIQKDKDKQARNKEAKIISEKLKVVETGLVPPGTEMEVDLKEIASNMQALKQSKSTTIDTEKTDKQKERHGIQEERYGTREDRRRSREDKRGSRDERRGTREDGQNTREGLQEEKHVSNRRVSDCRNDFSRNRFERYNPPRYNPRSPDRNVDRRTHYRSRSPYRRKSRSRSSHRDYIRGRNSLERQPYNQEPRKFRHYRDTSPTILRRDRSVSLSPSSNLSEREMWLHNRDSRNRKKSPHKEDGRCKSSRSRDFLEELASKLNSDKKKKSLLKEIHEKLNEPSPSKSHYSVVPPPLPVPAPMHNINMPMAMPPQPRFMPEPNPGPYFSPMPDANSQYDQQFFIGQSAFQNPNPYPQFTDSHMTLDLPLPPQNINPTSNNVDADALTRAWHFQKNNVDILKKQNLARKKSLARKKKEEQEAAAKLFEDKKISLSDFLAVAAKDADAKPINIQQKVKVLSLCQDAIRTLGEGSKFAGRFFVKRSYRDLEKKEDTRFQSPLRRIPVVRFAFTTPSKTADEKSKNDFNKLLISLGVVQQAPVKPIISPVISETSVKSVAIKMPVQASHKEYNPIVGAKFQMKMCQTDPMECCVCEIRKARRYVEQGVQCEIQSVDSSTQMSEEDQIRFGVKTPLKDNLKNQSLAHLTPAQILAAQNEESPKKNTFSGSRMQASPQSDIPSESQFRLGPGPNEGFPRRSDYMDKYPDEQFGNQAGRPNSREHYDLGPRPLFNNRVNDNRYRDNFNERDFESDNFGNARFPPNHRGKFPSGRYSGRTYY